MCTCNLCLFSAALKGLDLQNEHPEHDLLIEQAFMACEAINTDLHMLAINCSQRLEGKSQLTPNEINGGASGRTFLLNATTSGSQLVQDLLEATKSDSISEAASQALQYCALKLEIEIEQAKKVLDILNSGQPSLNTMKNIVDCMATPSSKEQELTELLHNFISVCNALRVSESEPMPPSLVVDMDSSNSQSTADVKKLVLQPSFKLAKDVISCARFLMLSSDMVSVEVKLTTGVFLNSYWGDEDGDFELSEFTDENLALLVHNNEFEITKLQAKVYNQKITVYSKHAIISCGLEPEEFDTCISSPINIKEFQRVENEFKTS